MLSQSTWAVTLIFTMTYPWPILRQSSLKGCVGPGCLGSGLPEANPAYVSGSAMAGMRAATVNETLNSYGKSWPGCLRWLISHDAAQKYARTVESIRDERRRIF